MSDVPQHDHSEYVIPWLLLMCFGFFGFIWPAPFVDDIKRDVQNVACERAVCPTPTPEATR